MLLIWHTNHFVCSVDVGKASHAFTRNYKENGEKQKLKESL